MSDWSENLKMQDEEIEALSSIYANDWVIESDVSRTYRIRIEEHQQVALLFVTMPPEYPSMSPPKLELSAPWMQRKDKAKLQQSLNEVYLEHVGETVIYQWVEKIRDVLMTLRPPSPQPCQDAEALITSPIVETLPEIIHGETITDRKSVFQGHMARVQTVAEAKAVIARLKTMKKISNATHNMWSYRFERQNEQGQTVVYQDCCDDGEDRGGARITRILQLHKLNNIVVVVSRWYGGIKLGPDRFSHIGHAARQVCEQVGLIRKLK